MKTKARSDAPTITASTPGIERMYVTTQTVACGSGYDFWTETVSDLEAHRSNLVASAIRGANGLHAPTLDVDLPVSVEHLYGSLSRVTITVSTRGWKVRAVQRALYGAGLVDWRRRSFPHNTYRQSCPSGLTRVEEVVLDIAAPVRLAQSSPGRHHLFIDHAMTARTYRRLLRALTTAGIVERGWAGGADGWTSVRTPR